MGLDAQDTSELFFDAVKVPKENVLGDAAKGFGYLSQFLCGERLISSIEAMALAQTAFDLTLEYAQQRSAFGRPSARSNTTASSWRKCARRSTRFRRSSISACSNTMAGG